MHLIRFNTLNVTVKIFSRNMTMLGKKCVENNAMQYGDDAL